MALGGGPPMLSLLTGVAQGVVAGQKDRQEREREAILNSLRQLQGEQTRQNMQLQVERAKRDKELHQYATKAAAIDNEMGVYQAQATQRGFQERDAAIDTLAQQIANERKMPFEEARQQAIYHITTNDEYLTPEEEEQALSEARARLGYLQAQTGAMNASAEARREAQRLQSLERAFMGNDDLFQISQMDLNQFRAWASTMDDRTVQSATGMSMDDIRDGYLMMRAQNRGTNPAAVEQQARSLVGRFTGGRPLTKETATAALNELNRNFSMGYTGPTDQESLMALDRAIEILTRISGVERSSGGGSMVMLEEAIATGEPPPGSGG